MPCNAVLDVEKGQHAFNNHHGELVAQFLPEAQRKSSLWIRVKINRSSLLLMITCNALMTALQTIIVTLMPSVMEATMRLMAIVTPEQVPALMVKGPPSSEKSPRGRRALHNANHLIDMDRHSTYKHNQFLFLLKKHTRSLK